MKPSVSIIVPVYNTDKQLSKCIESILCQTFEDFECILIDDFSTDSSLDICNRYQYKDCRVKVLCNTQNQGSSISRKIGLEKSYGEYIQFIDSDDWIEPFMIQKMYETVKHENLDIALCDFYYEESGKIYQIKQEIEGKRRIEIIKNMAIYNEKLTCALRNKLIKKDLLKRIEFPTESYSEDMYISTQLLYFSEKIGYINEPLYHFVRNTNSLCMNEKYADKRNIDEYNIYRLIIKFLKEKFGENICFFEPELSNQLNRAKMRCSMEYKNL